MKNYITPIVNSKIKSDKYHLYIKRDDLLPFSFGGNKVRIAEEYFEDMKIKGKDCIIGYGNNRSNLCRVLANMCYSRNQKRCVIVSPADEDGQRQLTYNNGIIKSSKAIIKTCEKTNVSETIDEVIKECQLLGYKPYYIYGDIYGNGNEAVPVKAYTKVYQEIKKQEKEMNIKFDYIFCATGTGMTQAGLIAGQIENNGNEQIIGISIARSKDHAVPILKKYLSSYLSYKDVTQFDFENRIDLIDNYIMGGYGEFNKEILNTIREEFLRDGIPLDPTYTGKAFLGMLDYLSKRNKQNTKFNVLFIHTGGTPLFFDNFNNIFT